MINNKNIAAITSCYGCGMCAKSCPQKIIEIRLNSDGFYEPVIFNLSKCTSCGLCLDVCAYYSDEVLSSDASELKSYAAWSKNQDVRQSCSSGGVGYEIASYLIENDYKVCCVKYNVNKQRAEHYVAETISELEDSKGSKYLQSFSLEGFKNFNRKDKYLVTGTPCQIDSVRRYIRRFKIEENFVLMDFFCHGVPSLLMWKKYLKSIEKQIGPCDKVIWRNKKYGWHDSWVMIAKKESRTQYESRFSHGDLFYQMFLLNNCLGKACYEKCKYKMQSSAADIRIGDLWGNKYKNNDEGVSAVLALTNRGNKILRDLSSLHLVEESFDVVTEGQMRKCPKKTYLYYIDKFLLRTPLSLKFIDKINRLVPLLLIPVFYIRTLLKR